MFVDHDAWSRSDLLPGTIMILKPGEGHPQGEGAVRSIATGPTTIVEDVVGFRRPEYFSYATRDGSLPVMDLRGELFFEERPGALRVRYQGSFRPKYPWTGWLFKRVFRAAQRSVLASLGRAYRAEFGA